MRQARLCTVRFALAMLASAARQGGTYPLTGSQVVSHVRASSSSLITNTRALHLSSASSGLCSPSSSPPLDGLVDEVSPYVPTTFTSIRQISRQMPPELMERVCDSVCGGLRHVFACYAERFETKMIGQVHVVRRRLGQRPSEVLGSRPNGGDAARRRLATPSPPMLDSVAAATPKLDSSAAQSLLSELYSLFPSYLVPVKTLWTTVPEAEEQQMRRRVLDALQSSQHRDRLIFHEHPAHCAIGGASQGAVELTSMLEHGYVQLPIDSLIDDKKVAATSQSPNARLAEHQVHPYEWYRVARVLPTAATEVLFTSELQEQANILLPPGRDVWQVLLSAPALFELRVVSPTSSESVPQTRVPSFSAAASLSVPLRVMYDATSLSSCCTSVYVRFRLERRFVPADMEGMDEEGILRELETLAADRAGNMCGLNTRQRRRKRKLQHQLAYLRNPTPYFDERVLAQHLFDLLPLRDGVHQSALLGALPQSAVQAFPQNVTKLFQERVDLFRLCDARHGVLVQRADAPALAQRAIESVTGEEVLLHIFSTFSLRSDPREGTTISRSLPRLPRLVRERLFDMKDVVAEVLMLYPDKVEILADRLWESSPLTPSSSLPLCGEGEHALRELRAVRGRRDFLVPFRFVGEWQDKLRDRYTRQQERSRLKSRPSGPTRPNHRQLAPSISTIAQEIEANRNRQR